MDFLISRNRILDINQEIEFLMSIKKSISWYQKLDFLISRNKFHFLISRNKFHFLISRNGFLISRNQILDIKKYWINSKTAPQSTFLDIKKSVSWYQEMISWYQEFDFLYQEMCMISWYQENEFLISRNIYYFSISRNRIFDIKKSISWYQKIFLDIKKYFLISRIRFLDIKK